MAEEEINFQDIMNKLQQKAEEDGKITKEEEQFLNALSKNVKEFEDALREAKYDKVISEDEFHDLIILRDSVMNKAMDFSTESEDINNLIQSLFDEINSHDLPGMTEDEHIGSKIEPEDED